MITTEVLAGVDIPILHQRWQRRYDGRALAAQIAVVMIDAEPRSSPARRSPCRRRRSRAPGSRCSP